MKNFFAAAIILIGTICAGCFQAEFDLTITDDGAVNQHSKLIGNALVIRQIEDWKERNERLNPDVKGNLIVEGDLRGYEFDYDYPDVESFAKSAGDLYGAQVGKNRGISRHETWFFDEYDFDFYFTTPPAQIPPEAEFMTQKAFNSVEFDLSIQLPNAAEKNNADKVDGGGKFLKWNLAPVLIHGGEKFMQARFKIWHRDKIALTAIIELIFLAAAIFFFIKARAEESDDLVKDFRLKRNVFAGLFVSIMIISAYLIFAPVTFTAADIISSAAP